MTSLYVFFTQTLDENSQKEFQNILKKTLPALAGVPSIKHLVALIF